MKLRSLFALALAALLAPAAAAAAPAPSAARPASSAQSASPMVLAIGGFVGYETDDVSGVALRVDGELPFTALAPQVNLSWVGSIGFSHLTKSVGAYGVSADWTANIFKIVPAARFSFPITPQFTLFADGGLGLYYASQTVEAVTFGGYYPYYPYNAYYYRTSVDDSELSVMMRIGGGAWFQVNPSTRIGASIEFNPYFGDFDQNTFIIQAGAMFRL